MQFFMHIAIFKQASTRGSGQTSRERPILSKRSFYAVESRGYIKNQQKTFDNVLEL